MIRYTLHWCLTFTVSMAVFKKKYIYMPSVENWLLIGIKKAIYELQLYQQCPVVHNAFPAKFN